MKVSKVIMIVVALHVLVIGGIFVFEGCSRSKVQAPQLAGDEAEPGLAPVDPTAPTDLAGMPAGMTPAQPTTVSPVLPPAPPAAVLPEPTTVTYSVKKGDSLWKIAKSEGTTMGELMRANNLTKTSTLKIGQKLTIPAKQVAADTTVPATAPAPADMAAAIPASAAAMDSGTSYAVVSGDSLWKIANRNGISVSSLKKANGLSSDSLKIGQKLTIPSKSAVQTASATTATPAVSAGIAPWSSTASYRDPGTYQENNQTIHVVDLNDTPAIIAKKYGVRVDDLMKANNIKDPKQIHYGQSLIIPLTATAPAAAVTPATQTMDASQAAPIVSVAQVN